MYVYKEQTEHDNGHFLINSVKNAFASLIPPKEVSQKDKASEMEMRRMNFLCAMGTLTLPNGHQVESAVSVAYFLLNPWYLTTWVLYLVSMQQFTTFGNTLAVFEVPISLWSNTITNVRSIREGKITRLNYRLKRYFKHENSNRETHEKLTA